jgi:hypothetical protein
MHGVLPSLPTTTSDTRMEQKRRRFRCEWGQWRRRATGCREVGQSNCPPPSLPPSCRSSCWNLGSCYLQRAKTASELHKLREMHWNGRFVAVNTSVAFCRRNGHPHTLCLFIKACALRLTHCTLLCCYITHLHISLKSLTKTVLYLSNITQ